MQDKSSFLSRLKKSVSPSNPAEDLPCWIVVGLGNPGERYLDTRHNAGFMTIDAAADAHSAGNWRARFDSLVSEKKIRINNEECLLVLAKPQTMMNRSGRAVKGLLKHYQASLSSLIVVHDDIDLPPGALRIKQGGGHGGHNGIRDIIALVGPDFLRVKVGVGEAPGRMDSADYVLQLLKGNALEELKVDAARAAEAVDTLMSQGLTAAQNKFN